MKHIYIFWGQLKSDWRNMALLAAGLIIFFFLIIPSLIGEKHDSTPLVRVGNRVITERDVVDGLKAQGGDRYLTNLIIDSLIESYAAQQNITVTPQEVEQVVGFEQLMSELQGQSMEEELQKQGASMDDYRRFLRRRLLQVKLLIPMELIEQTVQELAQKGQLSVPERYQIRVLHYSNAKDAQTAVKHLNSPDAAALQQALEASVEGKKMERPQTFVPDSGDTKRNKSFFSLIKGLKEGQCSKPMPIKMEGAGNFFRVVQFVKKLPEEKPTMTNRGLYVGNFLLDQEEFLVKEREMKADALNKIGIDPLPGMARYKEAAKLIADMKLNNPQIPSASPEDTAIPGVTPTGASGTNTQLAPKTGATTPSAKPTQPQPTSGQ